ncbi:MAG: type II secretion system protein GspJ [Leptospiraceae bacterium]|nr:type II secretion system protein GspJ [Leptospiraceae bacterium]MDW7975736.1 type II secretion system protein GspJ [Leptospiraceae bacterium]
MKFKLSKLRRGLKLRGFTLIELALAITALSVLFVVLFGVNFTVSRISKKTSTISLKRSEAIQALNILQDTIRMAYFSQEINKTFLIGKSVGITGNRRDQLTLTSVSKGSVAGGVVKEIAFFVKEQFNDTGSLFIREDFPDEDPFDGGVSYQLLEGVRSFQIQYSLNGVEWREEWDTKKNKRLPKLVRIQIQIQNGGKIETFETVAMPGMYIR